jgi:pimeloyl-ACP methyl ester carboxylesterase
MKNKFRAIVGVLIFLTLSVNAISYPIWESENQSPGNESGFIEIEPIHFYFHFNSYFYRLALTSSRARLWYTFQAADDNAGEKPLFIFFNGGPGSGTSEGLLSFYTGRMTLDNTKENGGDQYIPNPVSWTQLGNLLHVDARQTGFSYCLMDNSQEMELRRREFNAQNYNAFLDGADIIRLLLRFLALHPDIQDNPVIIVGESYGGIRTIVMLHLLLNYRDYGNGKEIYQDEALVQEIQEHYNTVFPQFKDMQVPPEVIATQFSHQILIQPALSRMYQQQVKGEMFEQEGSIIFEIAEEVGVRYIPCREQVQPGSGCYPVTNAYNFIRDIAQRDIYNCSQPRDWIWNLFDNASRMLGYTENVSLLTGVDVTGITHLYASSRSMAYRLIDPNWQETGNRYFDITRLPVCLQWELQAKARMKADLKANGEVSEAGDLEQTFGTLQPWDRYFMDGNDDVLYAHFDNIAQYRGYNITYYYTPRYGQMFLENVAHVETFITNAKYDLVVYTNAIPPALALHSEILENVVHDTGLYPGEERPGWIILTYKPGVFLHIPELQTRFIRFPFYAASGHPVTVTEPVEFFTDVYKWLGK